MWDPLLMKGGKPCAGGAPSSTWRPTFHGNVSGMGWIGQVYPPVQDVAAWVARGEREGLKEDWQQEELLGGYELHGRWEERLTTGGLQSTDGGKGGCCKGSRSKGADQASSKGGKHHHDGTGPTPGGLEAILASGPGGPPLRDPGEEISPHGEHFDNFVRFMTTTMQAVKRVVQKVAEKQPMKLTEIPGSFERHWGPSFEKSRLSLQDVGDLATLLSLFPEVFHIDTSNPAGPTVVCQPGQAKLHAPNEEVALLLWKRSRDLQPKKLPDCLEAFWDARERSRKAVLAGEKEADPVPAEKAWAHKEANAEVVSLRPQQQAPQSDGKGMKRSWEEGPGCGNGAGSVAASDQVVPAAASCFSKSGDQSLQPAALKGKAKGGMSVLPKGDTPGSPPQQPDKGDEPLAERQAGDHEDFAATEEQLLQLEARAQQRKEQVTKIQQMKDLQSQLEQQLLQFQGTQNPQQLQLQQQMSQHLQQLQALLQQAQEELDEQDAQAAREKEAQAQRRSAHQKVSQLEQQQQELQQQQKQQLQQLQELHQQQLQTLQQQHQQQQQQLQHQQMQHGLPPPARVVQQQQLQQMQQQQISQLQQQQQQQMTSQQEAQLQQAAQFNQAVQESQPPPAQLAEPGSVQVSVPQSLPTVAASSPGSVPHPSSASSALPSAVASQAVSGASVEEALQQAQQQQVQALQKQHQQQQQMLLQQQATQGLSASLRQMQQQQLAQQQAMQQQQLLAQLKQQAHQALQQVQQNVEEHEQFPSMPRAAPNDQVSADVPAAACVRPSIAPPAPAPPSPEPVIPAEDASLSQLLRGSVQAAPKIKEAASEEKSACAAEGGSSLTDALLMALPGQQYMQHYFGTRPSELRS